jgi:hypothetical protein
VRNISDHLDVIPAKAGIHAFAAATKMDSRIRGKDIETHAKLFA